MGCGFGRHSIALARRGYTVVGIDPSATMIEAALSRAVETGVSVDFRQMDGQSFSADQPFEAAICLFTTLGQISDVGDNKAIIPQIYEALQSSGKLLVEVPQRQAVIANLKDTDRIGSETHFTEINRHFDADTTVLTENFRLVSPETTQHFLLKYRLYSLDELTDMITQTGFTVTDIYGDYNGAPLLGDSPIVLVVCKK